MTLGIRQLELLHKTINRVDIYFGKCGVFRVMRNHLTVVTKADQKRATSLEKQGLLEVYRSERYGSFMVEITDEGLAACGTSINQLAIDRCVEAINMEITLHNRWSYERPSYEYSITQIASLSELYKRPVSKHEAWVIYGDMAANTALNHEADLQWLEYELARAELRTL